MKSIYTIFFALMLGASQLLAQFTIQQRLIVLNNAGITGGALKIGLQIKGNNIPADKTLGSMTVDITYDNTSLTWVNGTNYIHSPLDGYTRNAQNNGTSIRYACTGGGVALADGFLGWDIPAVFTTVVELNFTIKDAAATPPSFTNDPTGNQIGCFVNYQNAGAVGDPGFGEIADRTLDVRVNITDLPLPVELTKFTATAGSKKVMLAWNTATEKNNSGFDIERRAAGTVNAAQAANEWKKIAFVAGAGTTSAPQNYTYNDNVSAGKFEYRLKQIDRDGKFEYSKTIEATVAFTAEDFGIAQNYPNPFNPATTIRFAVKSAQHAVVKVFNSLGQEVRTLFNETAQPETMYSLTFDASGLPSGSYYYMLRTADRTDVRRMLLVK